MIAVFAPDQLAFEGWCTSHPLDAHRARRVTALRHLVTPITDVIEIDGWDRVPGISEIHRVACFRAQRRVR